MLLDVRTVMFSYILTDALCVLVSVVLWRQNRQQVAGLGFWVLDFAFQAAATVLILGRPGLPAWSSMILANMLIVGGALLGYMGLERFTGKVGTQVHNYVLLLAFVLVHSYFVFAQPSLEARNLNLSFGLLIVCAQCAWLLFFRVGSEVRNITRGVGLVFAAFCLVSLTRIVATLASPEPGNDFFRSGTFDTLILLSYQMLLLLLAYALTLMVNQRLLSQIQTQHDELKVASAHDSLTGLYNRRHFDQEILRFEGGRHFPVSIVVADLNDLKATNDRDGHAAGDALLVRAAEVFGAAFRSEDIVARVGGDEFAVLLPNTDEAASQRSLDRLRIALDEHNATHAGPPLEIAFGASTAQPGASLMTTVQRADDSMYDEKRRT